MQHVYLNGITMVAKQDSFPIEAQLFRITGTHAHKSGNGSASLVLSPNPTRNFVTVLLSTTKTALASFSLTNSIGQITERRSVPISEGETRIHLQTSDYTPGIYFLNVSVGDQRVSSRFVKK